MRDFIMTVYKQGWFYGCVVLAMTMGSILTIIIYEFVNRIRNKSNYNFFREFANSVISNLPSYILILAFLLALSSITLSFFDKSINSSVYEFFVSFIFAWLLTKVSSEEENKNKQREMAKKSFRHLIGIANSISHVQNDIANRMLNSEENNQSKERLHNIFNSFINIYEGIMSAKEDWGDILEEEKYDLEKEYISNTISNSTKFKDAFGKFVGSQDKKTGSQN